MVALQSAIPSREIKDWSKCFSLPNPDYGSFHCKEAGYWMLDCLRITTGGTWRFFSQCVSASLRGNVKVA